MSQETNIDNMKYAELQNLAKANGLNASGTKEDLVTRLKEAGITGASADAGEGDAGSDEMVENPGPVEVPAAATPAVNERVAEQDANRALMEDAKKMKDHLEAQTKVSIMIPFEVGENPETGKKVPFHVNLNGYAMNIPRGVYVEVPMQIADIIKARLESEGKIGADWRIDRDARKQEALG